MGGLTAAEIARLKRALVSMSADWVLAAFDGNALHMLPDVPNETAEAPRACVNKIEMDGEVKMANLAEVLKNALSLEVRDRATLAERLLASLEEITEEEAERLWAEEAERRLEEYRAGRAQAVQVDEVHAKAEQLFK